MFFEIHSAKPGLWRARWTPLHAVLTPLEDAVAVSLVYRIS
jgi:hypothetical protein